MSKENLTELNFCGKLDLLKMVEVNEKTHKLIKEQAVRLNMTMPDFVEYAMNLAMRDQRLFESDPVIKAWQPDFSKPTPTP